MKYDRSFTRSVRSAALFSLLSIGTAAPAVAESYTVECRVTDQSRARISGMPWKNSTYNYRLKFLVDPDARSVTSMMAFHAVKGNHPEMRYLTDVKVLNDSMVVFCADEKYGCEPFEDQTPRSTISGHLKPHVINLRDGSFGKSHNLQVHGFDGQSGFEESNATGSCEIVPS